MKIFMKVFWQENLQFFLMRFKNIGEMRAKNFRVIWMMIFLLISCKCSKYAAPYLHGSGFVVAREQCYADTSKNASGSTCILWRFNLD